MPNMHVDYEDMTVFKLCEAKVETGAVFFTAAQIAQYEVVQREFDRWQNLIRETFGIEEKT